MAAHRLHRPGLRQSHDQTVASGRAQQVVDARLADSAAVRQALLQIFALFALTKAVDAQLAGVAPAQHTGPGWHGDAGDAGAQFAPGALPAQPTQHGHVVRELLEGQLRAGAVPAQQEQASAPTQQVHEGQTGCGSACSVWIRPRSRSRSSTMAAFSSASRSTVCSVRSGFNGGS